MPQVTRSCLCCDTPLPGGAQYCGACGTEASLEGPGPAVDLELVRRALAGRYAVERTVGEGGMATVYLAEDRRHRRKVAIKVLRPDITSIVGSARFLQEIEIAARLQHPHILPVYDSGESSLEGPGGPGFLFYVMPFAGESLATRLARDDVPLADAVRILSQVADALAFAHAHGVVHRDIKPDNVMLIGRHAMVADFGIAKAMTVRMARQPRTTPGVPIGTPHYMAPEQVSGDPEVDGRADQYALGVVAYELLTRRRPFAGDTVQGILAAQVLDTPEPVDRLRPDLPPALAAVVMRCLEKEPDHRWRRSDELAEQLEAAALALSTATPPENLLGAADGDRRTKRFRGPLGAALLAAGLVVALLFGRTSVGPSEAPMSDQITFSGSVGMSAISPDGRFLAYASRDNGALLLQELSGGPAIEIARGLTNVLALRWSPDGTRLLAGGRYRGESGIHVIPRLGGPLRRVRQGRLAQWHPSGSRVSVWDYPDKSIQLVDLGSGETREVRLPGIYDWLNDAEWSPSGERVAYVTTTEPNHYALRMVGPDGRGARIFAQDSLPIGSLRWGPQENALYYLRGGAELRKVRLDRSSGMPKGDPITLLDGLQTPPGEVPGVMTPFTITADAQRLIYLRGLDYSNLWLLSGNPLIRSGLAASRRLTTGTAMRRGVAISPDMRWIAYLESSHEGTDLFRIPLEGGTAQRLTFGGRVASKGAAWSPDGARLAFGAYDSGAVRLGTIAADGGPVRMFGETSLPALGDVAWAPSRRIMHQTTGNRNFRLLDPTTGERGWLVPGEARGWIFAAHPSPDGERVAVFWNRRPLSGVWSISLRDASQALLTAGRWDPVGWSADGLSVLAVAWDSGGIKRVGLDGRTEALGTLPFQNAECTSAERAAREALVCVVPEQLSDVWMVAGFDPEQRART